MPIDPRILITTPVTQLLGIKHPILLATTRCAASSAHEVVGRVVHEALGLLSLWSS